MRRLIPLAVLLALAGVGGGARAQSVAPEVASTAPAQPARAPISLAFEFGPAARGGAHVSAAVGRHRGPFSVTARFASTDLERAVATGLFGSARDSARELALLGGYAHPIAGRWRASAHAGVAALRTVRREAGPCTDAYIFCIPSARPAEASAVYVGLPVEVGVHGPVAGAFGMGLRAFATLNAEETYGGVALALRLTPAAGPRPSR